MAASSQSLELSELSQHKNTSKTKRSRISVVKVAGYVAAFLVVIGVIVVGYDNPQKAAGQMGILGNATDSQAVSDTSPSVDQLLAVDAAAGLAERANLPVAPDVASASASLTVKDQLAQSDDSVIAKPQIIQPNSGTRDIRSYVVVDGDTVPSIAAKFGLTPDTVKWANNLDSDAVAIGKTLVILPVNGVKYQFRDGDSIEGVAQKYGTDAARIVSYNDLEISGPQPGQELIIPDGVLPVAERPGYVRPVSRSGYGSGYVVNTVLATASAGNRYAPGNCTWYAYERRMQLGRPVGSFWGNANTWDDYARSAGYLVNSTPEPGAVLVDNAGFYGHVAVVESVDPSGNIVISEMNNYAYGGFNIVDRRTISAGQASAYLYIH